MKSHRSQLSAIMDAAALGASAAVRLAVAWAIVAMIAAAGLGFAIAALWQLLALELGVLGATAMVAGILLVGAAIGALVLRSRASRKRLEAELRLRAAADRSFASLIVHAFTTSIAAGRRMKR